MSQNEITTAIFMQLGGQRFRIMTGAKDFVHGENSLTFRLPANLTKKSATGMMIRLDPSDTYTLELHRWNAARLENKVLDTRSDVYAENLREVFHDMTGLATSL